MLHSESAPSPPQLVRSFHVMVKPVGSLCNLDCTYCYYLHKSDLLANGQAGEISDTLLERFVRQYITEQDAETISFSWHGGEPTLLGLDFFRRVVQLQQEHAGTKRIRNDLQTNGLLIDEEWCRFFKTSGFDIGLSIDGPKHLHDAFRTARGGQSSFDGALRVARLLQEHKVAFNVLTVVNSLTAKQPAEVYGFLVDELGATRLQWLPCVEPKDFSATGPCHWSADAMPMMGTTGARPGRPDSVVTDWSVDPDDWGEFLCQTFDLWLNHGLGTVLVSWFESLVGQWMMQPPQICVLAEVCGRALAMEKDGSLYPCDHFVYPEYRLGNLLGNERRLADWVYSPEQRKFGCRKRDSLSNYCRQCSYRFACNGGCPKDRFIKTPDGQPGLNYLCSGMKRFLAHADPHLRRIVAQVHRMHNAADLRQ